MSEKELEKMFESAGIPLSKQTLSHIYQDLGPKMGKGVSIEQFQTFISENYGSRDGDNYEAIFKLYDRKNRGYFDLTDYKYVCAGIAKSLTDAQIQTAFSAMDSQQTGRVTL